MTRWLRGRGCGGEGEEEVKEEDVYSKNRNKREL